MAANEKISRALNSAKTRLNQSRRVVGEQKGNLLEDNVWHAAADLEYVLFLLSMRFQTELDKSRWKPNQKVKKDKVDKTIAIVQRLLNEAEISVTNKKLLNASIIESTLKFNKTIAVQPLSLVLKTALQGINETLEEMGIESNVKEAYESGVDFSPEATAERIVSFSTQLYSTYQEQHPEMDGEEALTKFIDIISQGINQGFTEARDVLHGLNVLEGEIAENIDRTYELVQDGLHSFAFVSGDLEKEQPTL